MKRSKLQKFKRKVAAPYLGYYLRGFDFSGSIIETKYDENGPSASEAFFYYESQGKILPTNNPSLLKKLLTAKASINLHIDLYAEDRAKGILPRIEFDKIMKEMMLPDWFYLAVENKKRKIMQKRPEIIW